MTTNKKPARSALGRGLSALISAKPVAVGNAALAQPTPAVIETEKGSHAVKYLNLLDILPGRSQPRHDFDEAELKELAESIKTLGVLSPILVRATTQADAVSPYEIIAGERRWRASKIAGLREVPAIVSEVSDKEALEIGLVENVQRAQLNPLEEARGYQRLMDEFSLTQKDIAERVGKDRTSVANSLRLLKLPQEVLDLLLSEKITMGHAKAILTVREPAAQASLARKVVSEGLSVRALEGIVSRVVVLDAGKITPAAKKPQTQESRPLYILEAIDRLRNVLGTKVEIKHQASGKGRIEIEYFSDQELDRLLEKISG